MMSVKNNVILCFQKNLDMAQKASIPKGTRDFGPAVMQRREYIFESIKSVFKTFGYQAIETPSMENLSTLLGKYGDEGDKLLFRILNSGDFLSQVPPNTLHSQTSAKEFTPHISEKGLRYDLTVPFARYVVMNRNDIVFPFKRYQIQPVWRADRPQKGRYREFYQCDVDVIGSISMLNEFELILILDAVFSKFNLKTTVHINNRKVLDGILQMLNIENKLNTVAIAIDKLDKIGIDNVIEELVQHELNYDTAKQLLDIISLKDSPAIVLNKLKDSISHTVSGVQGIEELEELNSYIEQTELSIDVVFDLSLARGLDYYTGAIFEVKAQDVSMGSICGGGRYDNLTAFFGLPDMSGVGISFGADRIYDVLNELNLFPNTIEMSTQFLFTNFGKDEVNYIFPLLHELRKQAYSAELYPHIDKMKKQMNYANKKNIPFVVIAGENEMQNKLVTIKNMQTGEQQSIAMDQVIEHINNYEL
jgi:histidyl-tRNA synthetase